MKKIILNALTELVSFIYTIVSFPVPATLFDPSPSPQPAETRPILLVHGYLHNSSGWYSMRRELEKHGFGPVYTINLGSPFHSIEYYACLVKEKAEQIAKDTKRSDLTLIGHSMGGVVCCYYAINLAPPDSIEQVFTLGSPLRGTRNSGYGLGKCTDQISFKTPPNPFISKLLKGISSKETIQFYHIGSLDDLLISPKNSAYPPIFKPHVHRFCLRDVGHVSLLFSEEVYDIVLSNLDQGTKSM